MLKKVEINMKKVGIVSCDKWIDKIDEDKSLKEALISIGIDAEIISWQKVLESKYDLLVLRSVWGYQNYYEEFKEWLKYIRDSKIVLYNDPDMILNNIRKDIQFEILKRNGVDCIETEFFAKEEFSLENLLSLLNERFKGKPCVIKPSISGSGENTFLLNHEDNIPNKIDMDDIIKIYSPILENRDCKIMVQPYISEINNGEYSCIFIDGELTHTMLRFPNIFHEKKKSYLVKDVPSCIIDLVRKVEKIKEFQNYLYMRVDMVIVDGLAKIMEVELAEPDLLTRNIDDEKIRVNVIKTFTKKIERRIR